MNMTGYDLSQWDRKVDPLLEEFRAVTSAGKWRTRFDAVSTRAGPDLEFKRKFHTHWTEAGHRIRQQLADDRLLVSMLRKVLPAYVGPDIELYRGENIERWDSRCVGFCWSPRLETAEMFASGLNAIGEGGVLIKCLVSRNAVIVGPSAHSLYLGEAEFTVDPFSLENIQEIKRYPPSS